MWIVRKFGIWAVAVVLGLVCFFQFNKISELKNEVSNLTEKNEALALSSKKSLDSCYEANERNIKELYKVIDSAASCDITKSNEENFEIFCKELFK